MKKFTLSIVSHLQAKILKDLLLQLDNYSSLNGIKVIITLNVDEEFLPEQYKNIKIIIIRNLTPKGFGANHNKAFEYCDTPWFIVLNPDLVILEDEPFTQLLFKAHQSSTKSIGVIAPQVLNEHGGVEDSVRKNITPWSLFYRFISGRNDAVNLDFINHPHSFYWLAGMCLIFNSSAFRQIQGFNERFFLYCEDYDICARLFISGFCIKYYPNFSIVHKAQRASHRSLRYFHWHFSSLVRVWTSKVFWAITLSNIFKH